MRRSRGVETCRERALLAIHLVVGLTGAFQSDLVLRDRPALKHWRSLDVRIGLRFRRRLRDLMDVADMRAVDWRNHFLVSYGLGSAGDRESFRELVQSGDLW